MSALFCFAIPSLILGQLLFARDSYAFGNRPVSPDPDDRGYAWVERNIPRSGDSPRLAFAKCQRWIGDRPRERPFVIALEGLASYQEQASRLSLGALNELRAGRRPNWPREVSAGYVLQGLLIPEAKARPQTFDYLVLPQDSVSEGVAGVAGACLAAVNQNARETPLVLVGHSYGGHGVVQLARALRAENIFVDGILTLDPRTKGYVGDLSRPRNVVFWSNLFQTNTPFLNGYPIPDADFEEDLSSTGVSHFALPYHRRAREEFRRILERRR